MSELKEKSLLSLNELYEQQQRALPDFCALCIYFQKPQRGPTEDDYRRLNVEITEEITVAFINPLDRPDYKKSGIWGHCTYLDEHFWDIDILYCQQKEPPESARNKKRPRVKKEARDEATGKAHTCVECGNTIEPGVNHLMAPNPTWVPLTSDDKPPEDQIIHACSVECAQRYSSVSEHKPQYNLIHRSKVVYPVGLIDNKELQIVTSYDPCAICNEALSDKDQASLLVISNYPLLAASLENGLIVHEKPQKNIVVAHQLCATKLQAAMLDEDLEGNVYLELSPMHPVYDMELLETVKKKVIP